MKKLPNPIDRHVGARVRVRRLSVGMSQDKLGKSLGITFQQIQKYENGANRIGASRLQQAAKVLGVPVSYFFEGAPLANGETQGFAEPAGQAYATLSGDGHELALLAAFSRVADPKLRSRIVALVEAMAETGGD
ncbi:MAG: helix-turn-helix domain-containing protein [Beijerinckiaceae bacterium]